MTRHNHLQLDLYLCALGILYLYAFGILYLYLCVFSIGVTSVIVGWPGTTICHSPLTAPTRQPATHTSFCICIFLIWILYLYSSYVDFIVFSLWFAASSKIFCASCVDMLPSSWASFWYFDLVVAFLYLSGLYSIFLLVLFWFCSYFSICCRKQNILYLLCGYFSCELHFDTLI